MLLFDEMEDWEVESTTTTCRLRWTKKPKIRKVKKRFSKRVQGHNEGSPRRFFGNEKREREREESKRQLKRDLQVECHQQFVSSSFISITVLPSSSWLWCSFTLQRQLDIFLLLRPFCIGLSKNEVKWITDSAAREREREREAASLIHAHHPCVCLQLKMDRNLGEKIFHTPWFWEWHEHTLTEWMKDEHKQNVFWANCAAASSLIVSFFLFFVFVLHLFSFAFCFSRHHHPHTFVKNNFHSPSVLSVWVIMMPWTVMVITKVRIFSSLLFFPKTYYAKKDIKTSTQHLHC